MKALVFDGGLRLADKPRPVRMPGVLKIVLAF
jgi:hypothetical protein